MQHSPENLPFGATFEETPDYEGGGYVLRDQDGFALVGKGVTYRDVDVKVEALVGYGCTDNSIAAEIQDSEGQTRFLQFVLADDESRLIASLTTAEESKDNSAFQWVDLQ